MEDSSLFGMLDQVSGSDAGEVFRSFIRLRVRFIVYRMMSEEAKLLCGRQIQPTGGGLSFGNESRSNPI
jgi:hypothetical protein